VGAIRYSDRTKCFVLTFHDGRGVRVSAPLNGLPAFARGGLAQAGQGERSGATRERLTDTAAGRLPKLG